MTAWDILVEAKRAGVRIKRINGPFSVGVTKRPEPTLHQKILARSGDIIAILREHDAIEHPGVTAARQILAQQRDSKPKQLPLPSLGEKRA